MKTLKASKLIKILQKLIKKHGDLPVIQEGYYADEGILNGVLYYPKDDEYLQYDRDYFIIQPPQNP